jgi:peptidoglycan/xylan/chitin deacetylase (PgdA/CDA1 family)
MTPSPECELTPSSSAPSWPWPLAYRVSAGFHAAAAALCLWRPEAWAFAASGLAANHAFLTAAGLWPCSSTLGPNFRQLPASSHSAVALTLDDGPDPHITPQVLDLLDEQGARATFFLIAEKAQRHAPLARDIVRRGHDVQNHSHGHPLHFSLFGPQAIRRELLNAQKTLQDVCGVQAHCFRAPAGLRNPFLDPVLHELELNLVSWTRRGFDTRERCAQTVVSRLCQSLAPRDILLLHDAGSALSNTNRQAVVLQALPPLLARIRDLGLSFQTLSQAIPRRHAIGPSFTA